MSTIILPEAESACTNITQQGNGAIEIDPDKRFRRSGIRPPECCPASLPTTGVAGFRMQCAGLPKPDTGWSDNSRSAGEVHFEHFG
jgi:hypothetical protein